MIVKGIIKSIDYSGNTCTVRIPVFESAANENEVVVSAILSTLPGIYNGYKEEDVVFIAFENNDYDMPVVIGKLYLGVENEKNDPRGAIVCNNITAAQPISIPISSQLTLDNDPQHSTIVGVDNGIDSYKSIADLAKNLQKQDEKIGSLSVKVIDDGENLGAEIAKKVSVTDEATKQRGLGWNLNTEKWEIYAKDSVGDNDKIDKFPIMTIDRSGTVISGNLVLTGYPKTTEIKYTNSTDKNTPPTGDDVKWQDNTSGLYQDTYYIWKRTREVFYAYNAETDQWELTKYGVAHYECITGAKGDPGKDGSNGTPATTYWAKLSTAVHTGKNQKSDIEITPYAKTGSSPEAIDTTACFKYSLDNGANWNSDNWTLLQDLQDNKIVISASSVKANDIIIKLAHAYTDSNDSTKLIYNEYETETIMYSPLNTPIIDLTNDTDVIKYKPDGNKITADVSSTAQVYLGGSPEVASYDWAVTSGIAKISKSNSNQTVTITSITSDKAIITCTATTTNFKDENGKAVQISKDFVVSREVVVASYWLSFSPVHTGNLQQTDIEVKALAKIGNDSESKDTNAYFRYSWDNGSSWSDNGEWKQYENATLVIPKADIQNNNLRIQATHDSNGDDRQVYEDETITYSPLNTPVLDLTNDSASLPYNGDTKIGSDVAKSTGKLWLNGKEFSGTYKLTWEAVDESCSIIQEGNTVSVNALNVTTAIARCTITEIEGYKETTLTKDFIISKSLKGADGKPGDSIYTISIDNDFDSVPADVNGNVSSSYPWESETKHNVRVYYGKEAQDFTVVDQSGTTPSTGLCLKYKLTNVALGNTPSVSSKVATAWINSLSADTDTGNILYTLYVDGVETGITGKFSATKIKSPAPTYTISIDNDFATIPTSTVNAKIYRKASQKFKPIDNGYNRETITIAGAAKKLPGMRLSAVNNTTNLNTALLWKPDEVIKITPDITKSYVEDITKHNVTVYCNDAVETITADNFIVKLDSDGLDANMDETQNYLVCELGGFDSTGARATDFPGMKPTVNDNVATNYIMALSALGDASESKNVYIQYTYYVKGKLVATAKFEVTRHTGPTTYYLSSNVSTIKVNKDATITPNNVICTAYSLDTSTNTNTKFTNGIWRYKWDNGAWSPDKSTASDLEISTAGVITSKYKQLYIELYLDKQLWDRETIDVIADGENAVDYRIIASSGTIKVTKTGNKNPQFITVDFKQINGSATPAAFSGNYKVFIDNGTEPTSYGTADSIVLATSGATSQQIDVNSATSRVTVDLYTTDGSTKLESETIDVVADGTDGQPGVYIKEVKQWYILKASSFPEPGSEQTPETIKPADNDEPTYDPAPTSTTVDEWMSTPPEAVNGYNIWTCYGSIFSNDTPEDRHIEYSVPVKDAAYALAQGKTTNYYSPTEPIHNVKKGDCWFDTGYVKIATNPDKKTGYLGKFVLHSDQDQNIEVDDKDKIYVQGINPDTSGTFTRFIPSENTSSQLYMVKITPYNIDKKGLFTVKTEGTAGTDAYETGNLKQCSGFNKDTKKAIWEDIAGELVTNKLTANYINAMDITAKKITVLQDNSKESNDSNPILFQADGTSNNSGVKIGGFTVDSNRLYAGTPGSGSGIELSSYLTGLIAYKSNNQGVKSSYAVSKITVNKATNLTVYIRSYAESSYDYTMISKPNAQSYPTGFSSSDVKAHTSSNQNSSSDLTGYTKVEYYGLKQNDYIYIVYRKDGRDNVGADTGYFLIPETADVSISNVGDYYFVRDSAFDINGASIKAGKNFSVDKDGNVFASSLNAPNLQIKEVNCAPTLRASSKDNYTKLGNWYVLPGSDGTIINLTPRTNISMTVGGDTRSNFAWLYNHADEYTNSDTVNLTYQNILNAVSDSGWGSGAPDSLQPNCLTLGFPWMSLSPDYSYYNNYAYTQVTGGELGGLHFGVGNTYLGTDAELMCPLLPIWDWNSQGVWKFRSHNSDQKACGSGIALDRSGSYVSGGVGDNAGTGNTWTLVGTWTTQSAITVSSDKNAKNTINELSDKYTNFFNNLKPVSFKYNDGTSNRLHIGFIAQDVEQALAEADIPTQEFAGLVIKRADDDSTSYGLRYSEFIALNTAQIQKLNAKVSSLEDTIAELRAEIAALKN